MDKYRRFVKAGKVISVLANLKRKPPLEKLQAWSLKETDIYRMGRYNKNILFVALWEMYDLMFFRL